MSKRGFATLLIVAGLASALVFFLVVLPISNPLRRSEEQIAAYLLEQTPPGTARSEVYALANEKGWNLGGSIGGEPPGSIGIDLGYYQGVPFRVEVFTYWVFDANDRLQTVKVYKLWDAL
jgi:HAMP domain-containing protein